MSLVLSPKIEAIVHQKVDAGLYEDADAAVQKAFELLDQRDRVERLRALIREGEEGEEFLLTPELMEEINREADEMLRQGIEPDPVVCP